MILFLITAFVAIAASILAITRTNAVHALLNLIVSFIAIAIILFLLGAPFIAALEVVVYAGAIMVLFIFVIMMLNVGAETEEKKSKWLSPKIWIGPAILSLVLFLELTYVVLSKSEILLQSSQITPKEVGISLFTQYILGIELVAIMLMAGIIGAYHISRVKRKVKHRFLKEE